MPPIIRKLAVPLLAAGGALLILLAVGIGGFRLLVAQLPSYQAELEAWVGEALGVDLDFERLDARLSFAGPELTLHEASVAASGRQAPFLVAREASVVFRPLALLRRELGVKRLAFEGTRLTVVRDEDGRFRLLDAPQGNGAARAAPDIPPSVEVVVRDSEVLYLDRARGLSWRFEGVTVSLRREQGRLAVEVVARPPDEFASRVRLQAEGALAADSSLGGDWRVSAEARELDFAVLASSLPSELSLPRAGRGDVSLELEWRAGMLVGGRGEAALRGVELARGDGAAGYDRLALGGDWQRRPDGWRLALTDVEVTRQGRAWPTPTDLVLEVGRGAGWQSLTLSGDFLRLEDFTPLTALAASSPLAQRWSELAPHGDVRALALTVRRDDTVGVAGAYEYAIQGEVENGSVAAAGGLPGVRSLSAALRADSRSGRLDLRTRDAVLEWPELFRAPLELDEVTGLVVWREGQNAVRVVSDDLVVTTPDFATRSSLELTLPLDGGSPRIDLELRTSAFDVPAVKRYLPAPKMPPAVVAWLDLALAGGRSPGATVELYGDLAAFPFTEGGGALRVTVPVEDGVLQYVRDWPRAEELTGTVEFVNASFLARGSGRILGNRSSDAEVAIADLREGVLTLRGTTAGELAQVLAFLQGTPLIQRHLGSGFARLAAPGGEGHVQLDLRLPLKNLAAYDLNAALTIHAGELALEGIAPHATDIEGVLHLADGTLSGEGIEGTLFDGPVTARVVPPEAPGYRARLEVSGDVTAAALAAALDLPFADMVAGQTAWQASLMIPNPVEREPRPTLVSVRSNLSGIALKFPPPFAKGPAEPTNVQVDLVLGGDALEASGHFGAARRFALELERRDEGGYALRRGAVRFGGDVPMPRFDRGLTIDGTLPSLDLDQWLALLDAGAPARAGGREQSPLEARLFAGADLEIGDFTAFRQQLGASRVSVRRRTSDWQIEVDSEPVAGTILVPADLDRQPRIVAVMERLYLAQARSGDAAGRGSPLDPRELPGLQLVSDEFAVGNRRLGRLDAEILPDPMGLRLVSFESSSESFTATGSGAWLVDENGEATTRFALSLNSTDVAATLEQLGFDPAIEAERAEATASVYWKGGPYGAWMDHVHGDVALRVEKGSLTDVEPGAGRVVGLMSISALPRRLALDFRDVFNRGLVFDDITADFVLIDGNAYTDNLLLTGPVAEIGIVGRTGLRDRDYRQQAVVTAEPGKMLPTVGGLIGGPTVAAALLIFTRIFKEPLKGIGRASYCVTGTWQAPKVERLTQEQLERGEICAELPPAMLAGQLAQPSER
ncbi:MAG TPA: YhdP family protein [Gammaproteobacteria bacterium]